jgi:transposase InsO family protein
MIARSYSAKQSTICRMSRRGNCYDNAVMESFFSTVTTIGLGDRYPA